MTPSTRAAHGYPRPAYAWYVVILLTIALVVSLVDRNILGLMIGPVKEDLGLNELQIGLLLGAAFALFYLVFGAPMGWLADRGSRRLLIAAGMFLWCVMTSLCGLANSFGALFAARLGVGVGEAALMPAALSLISDYFPRETRARAVSVLMTGALLGTGVAYLVGGPLVEYVSKAGNLNVPLLGEVKPWQAVFLIVGFPGCLIALLLLTIREPPRRELLSSAVLAQKTSVRDAVAYFRSEWRAYGGLFLGIASGMLLGYTALWTAALFERTWQWPIGRIGIAMGILIFAAAIPGTALSGWLSDRLRKRGVVDAPLRSAMLGGCLMVPGYVLHPLMPSGELALALLWLAIFGQAMWTAAGPACIVNMAPSPVRAQAIALYLIGNGIAGMLIGPACIGLLTDALGGPAMLRYSLTIVGVVFGALSLFLLGRTRLAYIQCASKLDAAADSSPSGALHDASVVIAAVGATAGQRTTARDF